MRLLKSQSYFWQILATIGVVSIGFQLITLSILAYYMLFPLGQRAADDLASVMTHAAETWAKLPSKEQLLFSEKMRSKHELLISRSDSHLSDTTSFLPYLYFLRQVLEKQLSVEVRIKESLNKDGERWFWVDIPVSDSSIRFGFSRSRIGVNPPIVFFALLVIGLCISFITAILLTRRLTTPIDQLYRAAQSVGKGHWPDEIVVDGPKELAVLTHEFNRMNIQVRELLSNRTALLAGIAHDLRTPLTQIQLALTLLPENEESEDLMESIHEDLKVINHLIGETLSISFELEEEEDVLTEVGVELDNIIQNIQTNGVEIQWSKTKFLCHILHPLAFRRIMTNLLVNAVRYGEGRPIEVTYECDDKKIVVQVLDRGPGIPAESLSLVFRPFYRLEKSRGSDTGGSGLGLAIVQQLADANKWNVELLSRPGGGTIAALTLPCATQ